jgi:hypothetical protein
MPSIYGFIGTTKIFQMDMNKKDEFITVGNIKHIRSDRASLAMQWIYSRPVAVMIASNMGRPGGACSQKSQASRFFFQRHEDAKTQEESVLTFIHDIASKQTPNQLTQQLEYLVSKFGMNPPTGDDDTDFLVRQPDNSLFNVRTSTDEVQYQREFGSRIYIENRDPRHHRDHKIYLSFISGPNAHLPDGPNVYEQLKARPAKTMRGVKQLDTVFRTISKPAADDYELFKGMVMQALFGSIKKISCLEYKHVIFAAPSSGLYAGRWVSRIQREYYDICYSVLHHLYMTTTFRFDAVIIPKF